MIYRTVDWGLSDSILWYLLPNAFHLCVASQVTRDFQQCNTVHMTNINSLILKKFTCISFANVFFFHTIPSRGLIWNNWNTYYFREFQLFSIQVKVQIMAVTLPMQILSKKNLEGSREGFLITRKYYGL